MLSSKTKVDEVVVVDKVSSVNVAEIDESKSHIVSSSVPIRRREIDEWRHSVGSDTLINKFCINSGNKMALKKRRSISFDQDLLRKTLKKLLDFIEDEHTLHDDFDNNQLVIRK